MASILVDLENVIGVPWFTGIEELASRDSIYLFYNKTNCNKLRADILERIFASGCEFHSCELVRTGKNSLDFYMAAQAGIISALGEKEIAIISNDKGLSAVSDFFNAQNNLCAKVIRTSTLEKAFIQLAISQEDIERRKRLQKAGNLIEIKKGQEKYDEKNRIKEAVFNALQNTRYESMSENIIDYFEKNKKASAKIRYTKALHEFGRQNGTEIYHLIKNLV